MKKTSDKYKAKVAVRKFDFKRVEPKQVTPWRVTDYANSTSATVTGYLPLTYAASSFMPMLTDSAGLWHER